jgi:hypothetical protein
MMQAILAGLVTVAVCLAQVDTATITGTIADPSGAAIVGAKITATSQTTRLDYNGMSTESGVYV